MNKAALHRSEVLCQPSLLSGKRCPSRFEGAHSGNEEVHLATGRTELCGRKQRRTEEPTILFMLLCAFAHTDRSC